MQEESLRCDVNLSVRPAGSAELGTRTEMKNLNSFKAISRAIAYETRRQIELIEEGKRVVQETRRWDDNKDATFPMRSKENAQDYCYFPESDIPPIELSEEYLDRLHSEQPEMAGARKARYEQQYGLLEYDTDTLTSQKALVDFFEETVALGDMMCRLKDEEQEPKDMKLTPANLAQLIKLISDGRINRNTAAKVFRVIFPDNADAEAYVKAHGLEQVNDAGVMARVVEQVFAANASAWPTSGTETRR